MWGVASGVFSATVFVLKAGNGSRMSKSTNRGAEPLFWISGIVDTVDSGI